MSLYVFLRQRNSFRQIRILANFKAFGLKRGLRFSNGPLPMIRYENAMAENGVASKKGKILLSVLHKQTANSEVAPRSRLREIVGASH